jgi:hypothetical protein
MRLRRTVARRRRAAALLCVALVSLAPVLAPDMAQASRPPTSRTGSRLVVGASESGAASLESAAAKASSTGRAVAMSLIALALAVAATVLAFRRDFKEAAGVFVVGVIAVLLATPAGLGLIRATVTSLFGAG